MKSSLSMPFENFRFVSLRLSVLLLIGGLLLQYFTKSVTENSSYLSIYSISYALIFLVLLLESQIKNKKIVLLFLMLSVVLQLNESIVQQVEIGFYPELIIEHTLRIFLPLVFYIALVKVSNLDFILKVIVALVFFGHGYVALGINNAPNNFHEILNVVLGFNTQNSNLFLKVIAVLDIACALFLFGNTKLKTISMYYMLIWGTLTAISRLLYGAFSDPSSFILGFSNMILRLPNGIIPLYLLASSVKINHVKKLISFCVFLEPLIDRLKRRFPN